ncbi:MAG: AgmX/PglI C-terminal domain-containing protein [Thermodesulfobacteriota bacterium]
MFALRPVIVFGKYKGSPQGRIVVTGRTAAGGFEKSVPVGEALASPDNAVLRLLWARHRIRRLADLNLLVNDPARVEEVTALGLKYSLMTQYTSFVAVDKVKRADGKLVTVKQPLPLPEGVSDLAVGADRAGAGVQYRTTVVMPAGGTGPAKMADAPATTGLPATEPSPPLEIEEGEKEAAPAAVTVSVEEIKGALTEADAEKALRARSKLLDECYRKATSLRKAEIQGEVIFKLVLDRNGEVKEIRTRTSTLGDAPTELCLETVLKETRFLVGQDGVELVVKVVCHPVR